MLDQVTRVETDLEETTPKYQHSAVKSLVRELNSSNLSDTKRKLLEKELEFIINALKPRSTSST